MLSRVGHEEIDQIVSSKVEDSLNRLRTLATTGLGRTKIEQGPGGEAYRRGLKGA